MNFQALFHSSLLFAVLFAGWPVNGSAQIELDTKLEYVVYLQFEPIVAKTHVRSRIGQQIVYNSHPDGPNFYYEVRNEYGHELAPLPEVPAIKPVLVPAQADAAFTNNMLQLYPMAKPGFYSIQPCVQWMNKVYRGEKRHLEIVAGREVTRITGVVPSDRTSRTYSIFHLNRGQQDHIALRIDDEQANLCYGVFSLGRSVMNERPQLAVDAEGNAHVLFQAAPRQYAHLTYSPFGREMNRQFFGQNYQDIFLKSMPDGSINAQGRPASKPKIPMVESIINNR